MRTIAIANEKGGVGKTSTAVSLAAALAELGRKVLLLDLDPSAAASAWLGVRTDGSGLRAVFADDEPLAGAVVNTAVDGLDLVPSGRELVGLDKALARDVGTEHVLRRALAGLKGPWQYVIIDTPPGLSLPSVAALAAAGEVLVPVEASALALEGVAGITRTLDLIRAKLNPDLKPARFLAVRVDRRTRLAGDVVDKLRESFGKALFEVEIPVSTRLAEAPGFAKPITAYASMSPAAEAYRALALEVERKGSR